MKYVRVGLWGLNVRLRLTVVITLFPGGLWQMVDGLNNGYCRARSQKFRSGPATRFIEWIRIVPDLTLSIAGVVPRLIAAALKCYAIRRKPAAALTASKTPICIFRASA